MDRATAKIQMLTALADTAERRERPADAARQLLEAATLASDQGDCARAVALVERAVPLIPEARVTWSAINECACLLINGGRYREALELEERWSEWLLGEAAALRPADHVLARLNQVEALYNLGALADADALLDAVEDPCRDDGWLRACWCCQRAWLSVLMGDTERAGRALERYDSRQMAERYRAEGWFARAALRLATGELDAARAAARNGQHQARRPSSQRNARFLLARIDAAAGDRAAALAGFEAGAAHRYVGQGGPDLLAWAELLEAGGEDAYDVHGLVVERDPQSPAAAVAEARRC